jgi:MOSC domain-containing protein YiiM
MQGKTWIESVTALYASPRVAILEPCPGVSAPSVPSGIGCKQACDALVVGRQGVLGDTQEDPKHHGGADRVLHHFPREHYGQYRRWDLMRGCMDAPTMGENISTVGLDETEVHIGDIVQFGEVVLQVTQPRSPCFKLNLQFGHESFALAMQQSQLCGWFYRALTPGTIRRGDSLILIERVSDISVAEAMALYFAPEFDANAYLRLVDCEGLAESWKAGLRRRLAAGKIEDWRRRLYGTAC